jgi:hypothetical protein
MAKVTGPLMSLDASGTVGKTTTFSKWKGRNYVRLRVTPLNPRSNAMQLVRQKMGGIGYALSFVGVSPELTAEDSVYGAAKAAAPAGQSWISFMSSQIAGANFGTFNANAAAYAILSGTIQGYYDAGAATLALATFSIANAPVEPSTISGGELLFHIAQEIYADMPALWEEISADHTPSTVDEGDITALVGYVVGGVT